MLQQYPSYFMVTYNAVLPSSLDPMLSCSLSLLHKTPYCPALPSFSLPRSCVSLLSPALPSRYAVLPSLPPRPPLET